SGARYLLFGQVQKMSTLIGSMRFAMLDLEANSAVCDRFLTYRGDTDEAWRRASNMLVEEIRQGCLGQEPRDPYAFHHQFAPFYGHEYPSNRAILLLGEKQNSSDQLVRSTPGFSSGLIFQ